MSYGYGVGYGYGPFGRGTAGSAPAWEQILTLAQDDGWTAVYDPTNPNTRTLRESGGNSFVAEISDGLGNLSALVQATEANQPAFDPGAFGDLDAMDGSASSTVRLLSASVFDAISQPFTFVCLTTPVRVNDGAQYGFVRGNSSGGSVLVRTTGSTIGNQSWEVFAGVVLTDPDPFVEVSQVVTSIFNEASSAIRVDGSEVVSGDTGSRSIDNLEYFQTAGGASQWQGPGAVWLIRADASLTEIAAMEAKIIEVAEIGGGGF